MTPVTPAYATSVFVSLGPAATGEHGSNPFMPSTADVLAKYRTGFSLLLGSLSPSSQTAVRSALARAAGTSDPAKAERLAQQALLLAQQLARREAKEKEDQAREERLRQEQREERRADRHRTQQLWRERKENLAAIEDLRRTLANLRADDTAA